MGKASISSSASPPKQIAVASSKKEERKREGGCFRAAGGGGGRWKINDDSRPDFVVLFCSLIIRYTEHLCAPAIKQLNATV